MKKQFYENYFLLNVISSDLPLNRYKPIFLELCELHITIHNNSIIIKPLGNTQRELPMVIDYNNKMIGYCEIRPNMFYLHRNNDLPSCLYKNGSSYYYQNGLLDREDKNLPAIISDKDIRYFDKGKNTRNVYKK